MAVTGSILIRSCEAADLPAALGVINAAGRSYRTFLPPAHYHEPLMTPEDFRRVFMNEISGGICVISEVCG